MSSGVFVQKPLVHLSAVHGLPSSHAASVVHGLAMHAPELRSQKGVGGEQTTGLPAWQAPARHVSAPVHGFPSSHPAMPVPSCGGWMQAFCAGSRQSKVHGLPSSHSAWPTIVHCEGSVGSAARHTRGQLVVGSAEQVLKSGRLAW